MKEKECWDRRYGRGGGSGKGSIGQYRKWKWRIIKRHVKVKKKSVLDVGCGDLSFLKGKRFKDYTGIDVSEVIIEKNRKAKPSLTFVLGDASNIKLNRQFDIVLCFDLLFHIMNDERYGRVLDNLNTWTRYLLFVNTWSKNPLPNVHDGEFQYFRDLDIWLDHLDRLELVKKYPHYDGFNMMYVFRRAEE